jgi:NADH-quinone oxidoreductase subunit M
MPLQEMIPWFKNLPLWVTAVPLIGALLLLFVPKAKRRVFELGALIIALLDFALSVPLWFQYDRSTADVQWVTQMDWIPSIGVQFSIGMDGISLVLFLLTTLIGAIAVWCSFTAITDRFKEFYIWLLVMQFTMLGVFICQDMFLFYLFWEIMLVPMYFLIAIWGGPQKLYAAIKLFLYTLTGGVLMLVGILAIYFLQYKTTGTYDLSIASFHNMAQAIAGQSQAFQVLLCLSFFIGFAIKVPMFPFHTWLPDAHVQAPTAGSVILAGILLKMGTYGFVRFLMPIFPNALEILMPWFLGLAIIGIVYGALVAMIQKDMKKLVAYSSVSHLGMCMLGLFALNPNGIMGGMFQMINHGISTSGLFLIVGIVYERRHVRQIADFGGLSKNMPLYATVFMIMTMSSIGLPGLNGFIGEFAILQGAFQANPWWAVVATSGIILGAAYMLWLYQRTMFGKLDDINKDMKDLNAREIAYFAPLVIAAFWIGLRPSPIMDVLHKPIEKLVMQVNPEFYNAEDLERIKAEAAKRGIRAMEAPDPNDGHSHDGHSHDDHSHEGHSHTDHGEAGLGGH